MSFGRMGARGGFGRMGVVSGNSSFLLNPSNPADVQLNFTSNRAWTKSSGVFSTASSLLTVVRALPAALVNDGAGNWSSVGANLPRISNLGLLVEEARTNLFLNSAVPATQTITVASGSTYSVSVIGTGSLVLTGAMTGTVTQGSSVIGAASTTSLTVTTAGITGTFVNAQVELGASVTSPIVTAGASATRAADLVTLTSAPAFGAAYSIFASGTPQAPNAYGVVQGILTIDDGSANNRAYIRRHNSTADYEYAGVSGGTTQVTAVVGTWAQNTSKKIAAAFAANDQQLYGAGAAATAGNAATMPVSPNRVDIGASTPTAAQFFNGFIEQAAIWSSQRLSNATLQVITT